MHSRLTVLTGVGLARTGASASAISSRLEVPRATVRDWLSGSIRTRRAPAHALAAMPSTASIGWQATMHICSVCSWATAASPTA